MLWFASVEPDPEAVTWFSDDLNFKRRRSHAFGKKIYFKWLLRGIFFFLYFHKIGRCALYRALNSYVSFILDAGGNRHAESSQGRLKGIIKLMAFQKIPYMDKGIMDYLYLNKIQIETFDWLNMRRINTRLMQCMVYLCFSNHLWYSH